MDTGYISDSRKLQSSIDQIYQKSVEISRLIDLGVEPRDLIDSALRQSQSTKQLMDQFKEYTRVDPIPRSATYQRYSADLQSTLIHLENSVKKLTKIRTLEKQPRFTKDNASIGHPTFSAGSSSSLITEQEGTAMFDLRKIEREMDALHRIYESLHHQALEQQGTIETVTNHLSNVESNLDSAKEQLLIKQKKVDSNRKWKFYMGMTAFIFVLFVVYSFKI
jgi:t-SNARE complex subunit (syntaxin)